MQNNVNIKYFNKILINNNLHEWISNLFESRLGIKPIVYFKNNNFFLQFNKLDSTIFIIQFTNHGRKNFFRRVPYFLDLTNRDFDDFEKLNLVEKKLIFYGINKYKWLLKFKKNNLLKINYDFISYLIWTLNRIEEKGIKSNDKHGRFELSNSHLNISQLYMRPIVDEWFIFFYNLLKINGCDCKKRKFSFSVSHDVDEISRYKSVPFITFFPRILIDVIKRPKQLYSFLFNRKEFLHNEHSNTFDWLMKTSEKFGIRSKFYFIPLNSSYIYDYRYTYSEYVKKIMRSIYENGHEIGIHYSYNSSIKRLISKEWYYLQKICELNELPEVSGGRMHYLRFDFNDTINQLVEVGQSYDNSMTFFETGGFRCGTCYEYQPFDIFNLKILPIIIKPLILMEGSVLTYMNLNIANGTAFEYMKKMINSCYEVGGDFSLLWHNSVLETKEKKLLYINLLAYCSNLMKSQI